MDDPQLYFIVVCVNESVRKDNIAESCISSALTSTMPWVLVKCVVVLGDAIFVANITLHEMMCLCMQS